MDFLDRVKKGLGAAAESVSTAASRQMEILRLNREIGELKEDIDKFTLAAGKRALALRAGGKLTDGELNQLAESIQAAEGKITELQAELAHEEHPAEEAEAEAAAAAASAGIPVSGAAVSAPAAGPKCAKCGAALTPDQQFCQSCGQFVPRCSQCGKVAAGEGAFCAECGGRINRGPAAEATEPPAATG